MQIVGFFYTAVLLQRIIKKNLISEYKGKISTTVNINNTGHCIVSTRYK